MTQRKIALAASFALILVAASAFVLSGDIRNEPPSSGFAEQAGIQDAITTATESTKVIRRVVSSQPAIAGFYRAPIGTRLDYAIDVSVRTTIGGPQSTGGQTLGFDLKGVASLVVVDRRSDEVVVAWTFPAVEVEPHGARGATNSARGDAIERDLARSTLVRTSTDGAPLGYRFAEGIETGTSQIVRSMVTTAQQIVQQDTGSYELLEPDATGIARVSYWWRDEPREADETGILEKRKLAYQSVGGTNYAGTVRGHGQAEMDRIRGIVLSVGYEETVGVDISDAGAKVRHGLRFAMKLEHIDRATAVEPIDWSQAWAPVVVTDSGEEFAKAYEEREQRELLRGVTVDQVLAVIKNLLAVEPLDRKALLDASRKLSWLIRFDPSALDELRSDILTARSDSRYASVLLGAIGGSDIDPAQGLLGSMLQDSTMTGDVRNAAALSMFQLTQPNAEALAAARAVSHPGDPALGNTGMLLLGGMAGRARNSAHGAESLRALLALEEQTQRSGDLASWLYALGNHGGPEIAQRVHPHVSSPDQDVRRAAAVALGTQSDQQSTQALVQLALADREPSVRSRAIAIVAARGDELAVIAVQECLTNERSAAVRHSAVEQLGNHLDNPELAALLRQAAQNDTDAGVRTKANRLLQG